MNPTKRQNPKEIQRKIYDFALEFIKMKIKQDFPMYPDFNLNAYLSPDSSRRPQDMRDLFKALLLSAQNANMKAGVIGGSLGQRGNIDPLGSVLFDFDHIKVLEKYDTANDLFWVIKDNFKTKDNGKFRSEKNSIWPKYCVTILSTAEFLTQFKNVKEFSQWMESFMKNSHFSIALPMIIENEIDGFGFALACDFVKEYGYENFGKPDVHIKDIFCGLGFADSMDKNYQLFKKLVNFADTVGETPYAVDKVFWLIGSGNLYMNESPTQKKGRKVNLSIGNNKHEFIRLAKIKFGI